MEVANNDFKNTLMEGVDEMNMHLEMISANLDALNSNFEKLVKEIVRLRGV